MKRVRMTKNEGAIALAMVALCLSVITVKVQHATRLPYYDPNDGDNFFWTEAAFHFRHAAMISRGEDIPKVDHLIQYPEGLSTRRYVTPVMEQAYGRIHRALVPDMPLHRFLTYATAIFSTVSVVICFWAARTLWGSGWVGLMCAFLYGLAPASMVRTSGNFLREDFALPFLFGSFACFTSCWRKESRAVAVIGALLLIIALASWHVSQFFVQLAMVGCALLVLLQQRPLLPRQGFTIYALGLIVAAALLEVLRAKYYFLSVPLMLTYGLLVILWLFPSDERWSKSQIVVLRAVVLLLLGAVGFVVQYTTGAHSHVLEVLYAKLRFLGQLPADPTRLSFEAKTMWTTSFVSPTWPMIGTLLSTTLLFAVIGSAGWGARIRRRDLPTPLLSLLYWTASTLVLFLLFHRLCVFAVFFLSLFAGAAWPRGRPGSSAAVNKLKVLVAVLFVMAISFELWKYSQLRLEPNRPDVRLVRDVTAFLRKHAEPADAVASSFELGPSIAAYADVPVLLHSKFESLALRDKVRRLYTALYRDESFLYKLCRRYRAGYFIYQVDFAAAAGPRSVRYIVGAETLSAQSAAFKLHFTPDELQYFHLVHQNAHYRIYRVSELPPPETMDPPYEVGYDLSMFSHRPDPRELTDEQVWDGWRRVGVFRFHFRNAQALMRAGRTSEAEVAFGHALRENPRHVGALVGRAQVLTRLKRYEQAGAALAQAIARDARAEPDSRRARDDGTLITLAIARSNLKDVNGAIALLHGALQLNPESYEAYNHLSRFYTRQQRFDLAIDAVARSLAINPQQPHLRRTLDELRAQTDRVPSVR